MNNITLPHINLNGTGVNMLADGYANARAAIIDAIDSISQIEFHSRDYMQQQDGKAIWQKAVAEHEDRIKRLQSVADEYLAIMEHIEQFRKS